MGKLHNDETGLAIVEATILLPFCMVMVIALYYAAIFMCQKANLQANLQNALIYYKNTESDTYVKASDSMAYVSAEGTISAVGGSYGQQRYLFPYRFLSGIGSDSSNFEESAFEDFFRSMCGHMFFDSGTNVELAAHEENYVVYKVISATVTQTVRPAVSLEMIGIPSEMTIEASASVVISDGEEFIRNIDFAIDIISGTRIGQAVSRVVEKANDFYLKFKQKFHIQ